MLCFRDVTFCSSPNCKGMCGRQWTEQLQKEADKWWGKPGAPVAFANFCDEHGKYNDNGYSKERYL